MGTLPSNLPDLVQDDEDLARFLTQSSLFTQIMVKPAAFLPSRDRETSVSRHGSDHLEELWTLGLHAAGTRPLYGAAVFKARVPRKAGLEVFADEPPLFHAVIRGWPWDEQDPVLLKACHKDLATKIAQEAALVLRASTPA